jgi:hypothetical protein
VTLAVEALFANVKPTLDAVKKLGMTDFSADAPGIDIKPGATLKVPVSSVEAASEYNDSTNNYLTGGATDWANLTAKHYLQGFDLKGTNLDEGVNAARVKQLFTARAGTGIAIAIQGAIKDALNGVAESTAVTFGTDAASLMAMGDSLNWLDKASATLVVNGTQLADIKTALAEKNIVAASLKELAGFLGFADMVLLPGIANACIVPASSMGFVARVPSIVASYKEVGVETDPDTGLSVGIVVADEQATNRIVANADLWFGCTVQGAPAAAGKAGVVKIG